MGNQLTTLGMGQEFKKTPVGTIPVHWRVKRLGDLADIQIGGTPSRSNPAYWDTALQTKNHWVAISDMKSRIIENTKERLTDLGVQNSNVKKVPKGTVLMSFKLTIGRVAITGVDLYTNEAIAAIVPDKEVIPEYLFYVLPMIAKSQEADIAVKGQTLNKAKLQDMLLPVPPIEEQADIAKILDGIGLMADATTSLIERTQQLKSGLFQRLLPADVRAAKNSRMVSIAECTSINVAVLPENTAPDTVIQYIDISSIGQTGEASARQFSFKDAPSRARRVVQSGDILVSTVRPYLKAFTRVRKASDNCIASTGFAVLTPNEDVDGEFIYQFILSNRFVRFLERRMVGSNYPAVTAEDVGDCPIPLPPLKEQVRIAQVLAMHDCAIATAQSELVEIEEAKTVLAKNLLKGKIALRHG